MPPRGGRREGFFPGGRGRTETDSLPPGPGGQCVLFGSHRACGGCSTGTGNQPPSGFGVLDVLPGHADSGHCAPVFARRSHVQEQTGLALQPLLSTAFAVLCL